MIDWYIYHLSFLAIWIVGVMIQTSLELLVWKRPQYLKNAVSINYKLNIFLGYPAMLGMGICFAFLFNPDNLQFPTYIIFVLSNGVVLCLGLFSAFLIHKRSLDYAKGGEEVVGGYINRIRLSFMMSVPAALLTAAAELHITTNWITEFLN